MSKIIEIIDSDEDNHIPATTDLPSTSYASSMYMEQDDNQQSQSRRRRRKSVLHAMTDPDMQFQTIAVDDDEPVDNQSNSIKANYMHKSQTIKPSAAVRIYTRSPQKTMPKIIAPKPQANKELDAAFEEFLNGPEIKNDIYSIAEERVRINYLLSLNGMPEINFSLYTRPERLQWQLEERLKQRKAVHNRDPSRVPEARRNFLQNNSEKDTTQM